MEREHVLGMPERRPDLPLLPLEVVQALAGGVNTAPAATEALRRYWTTGEGNAKIRWGTSGAFTRCVRLLREHMPAPGQAEGYCANLCKRATGQWPGEGEDSAPGR